MSARTDGFQEYVRLAHKSGHYLNMYIDGRVIERDDGGRPTRISGVMVDVSDLSRVQEDLRRSHEQYRSTVEHLSDGVILLDAHLNILLVNDAFRDMAARLGIEHGPVGCTITDLLSFLPHDVRAEYNEAASSGRPHVTERVVVRDNEELIVAVRKIPVFHGDDLSHFVVIVGNVTEQRQMARRLVEERDRARQYLDVAGSMIIVMDRDACITTVNQYACDVLGYTPDELVGRDIITTLFDPGEHGQLRLLHRQIVDGEMPDYQEWQNTVRTKSGEARTVVWWNSIIRDADGSVAGIIGSGVDITHRLHMQAELSSKSELLNSIIATIPGYIFWKDADSRYLGCNSQFARAAGLSSPYDVIGKTDYDLVWDRHEADFYRECDRRIIDTGTPTLNIEETQRRPDGTVVDILTNKVPLRDNDGNIVGILGIYSDITELKDKEKELQRRTKELGERVKELSCMFNIMRTVRDNQPLDDLLQAVVRHLPPGWQYPDITCARLRLDDKEFTTDPFQESPWVLQCPIRVNGEACGSIEVFYTKDVPALEDGPFLQEERGLLSSIAEVIGETIALRNANTAVQQSRDFLQRLVDAIPQPLFYKDHEHIYRFVNRALCEYLEQPLDSVLGHNVFDIQPLSRAKEFNDHDRLLLKHGGTQDYETVVVLRDSAVRPVRMHKAVLKRNDGSTEGLVGVITDLSEIKRKEYELRESRDTMNAILTTIQTGLMLVDTETQTVTDVNAVAAKMIGRSRNYIVGRPCSEFLCPGENQDCVVGTPKGDQSGREMTLKSHRHREIPVINSITRVQLGDRSYLLQNFLDISKRIEAERALAASEHHYRALFENALDIVAVLSGLGRIEYASPSLAHALGHDPSAFVEIDIHQLLYHEDVDAFGKMQRDLLERAKDIVALEFRLQHQDGSYRQFEGVFGLLPDVTGAPRIVVNARDVTERRREEMI
ncbi:MAG: PAS domain S-box protein, partial [candidate division Zixibacteria bacterium]|nr:PAS domain S-box protein [candidate division Zixibacteria bacterium]